MAVDPDKILHLIKDTIERASSVGPFTIEQTRSWAKKQKLNIPFHRLPLAGSEEAEHLRLSFAPPSSVNIIGGYAIKSCLSPPVIDMTVEMGADLIKEKDHMNYRYFHKRAFYLACIQTALVKCKGLSDVRAEYELGHSSELMPVLVMKWESFSVRILPFTRVFKPFRLAPSRCSLRASVLSGQILGEASSSLVDGATPNLNSLILSDIHFEEHAKVIRNASSQIPAFLAGLKLAKAWLLQRCYANMNGGVTSFHVTMLFVLMAQMELIDASMDEFQIFKTALKFFSSLDTSKPLSVCTLQPELPDEYKDDLSVESFQKHFELVFIDPTGFLNVFWNVRKAALDIFAHEAKVHFDLLTTEPSEASLLLITSDDLALKYDSTVVLQSKDFAGKTGLDSILSSQSADNLTSVLVKALTDRIRLISVHSDKDEIRVGLILNAEQAFRLTDLGPPIEDKPGCAAFRAFWGDKSELRRFKDSAIKETVVWEEFSKERHLIVGEICKYILAKTFNTECVRVIVGQLDNVVEAGTFLPVMTAFDDLSRKLRTLANLPLTITGCEAVSSSCYYASVEIPKRLSSIKLSSGNLPLSVPLHEVIVRTESSGKWPQDPHAAKLLKQAFLIQICRQLVEQHGLEVSFAKDFVDVLCESFVFRCHLTFAGEIALSQRHGLDVSALEELTVERLKHARAIHSLYTSNVVYGPAARTAKRFIGSQLMSDIISEELVELLMAYVFLHPGRYSAPASAWTAFLRFLHLISTFDWEVSPLAVNFDGELKTPDVSSDYAKVKGHVCLFVATSYDNFKLSSWSLTQQHERSLSELKKLSAAALKYLCKNPFADLSVILKRSLKAFDGSLVLNLRDRQLSRQSQLVIRNSSLATDFIRYLPGFDPLQTVLADLKANFGKQVQLFYDQHNPSHIAYRRLGEQQGDLNAELSAFARDLVKTA